MIVHRLVGHTPPKLLASPGWGIDRREAARRVEELMEAKDVTQGDKYMPSK
jgi:radical SAM superfamily enzyme